MAPKNSLRPTAHAWCGSAMRNAAVALALLAGSACGSSSNNNPSDGNPNGGDGGSGSGQHDAGNGSNTIPSDRTVFVIVMENESSSAIYNSAAAPYINATIKPESAWATMFIDELPSRGTERAALRVDGSRDERTSATYTFTERRRRERHQRDDEHAPPRDPAQDRRPRVAQLSRRHAGAACPISSSGFYAAKHDPFVFFTDVSGSPPSATNTYCAAHHKAYTAFAADLAARHDAGLRVHHAEPVQRHARRDRLPVGLRHHARRYVAVERAAADRHVRDGARLDHLRDLGRGQHDPDHPVLRDRSARQDRE